MKLSYKASQIVFKYRYSNDYYPNRKLVLICVQPFCVCQKKRKRREKIRTKYEYEKNLFKFV